MSTTPAEQPQTPAKTREQDRSAPAAPPASPAPPEPPEARRRLPLFAVIAVVVLLAALVLWLFLRRPAPPANVIQLSGRVEGDDSAVAGKTTGRLLEIHFREGDTVEGGQVIAVLDDVQVRAREDQSRAGLAQAEARLRSARQQISILGEQARQSGVEKSQSQTDAQGRVRQAEAELAAADADLAQQEASYELAVFDRDAYSRLVKTGAVSERQGKQAASTAAAQAASVAAAKRRSEAARGALTTAESSLRNPDLRSLQLAVVQRQITQQHAEISSALADEARATAQLAEAQADRNDLRITAPFTGTVVTRTAEPGELLSAGTPVITLLDLHKVYLRGYIPEGEIGHVKVGQPARLYLDSDPHRPLDAYVGRVDPQATFTPENTYFQKDRVKQVVGVKLYLKSGFGLAKPGMPADGEVLTEGDSWPSANYRR